MMRAIAAVVVVALLVPDAHADPGIRAGGEARHELHVDVESAFTYAWAPPATGLGVLASATGLVPVWNARAATGTVDVTVELGYQNQPYSFFKPYLGAAESLSGGDHRVNLFVAVGHSVHLLHSRRLAIGVQAVGGLTYFASSGRFTNSREAIAGSFWTDDEVFAFGLRVALGIRFSRYFGLRAHVDGFPLAGQWGATGIVSAGLGLFAAVR